MPVQKNRTEILKKLLRSSIAVVVVFLTYFLARRSYLLFHSLTELFSIVVAWNVFVLSLNTRRFLKTGYFTVLGTGFFFVGFLDIFHILAYKGINVFPVSNDGNAATQFWIASRYLLAFSFLTAPLFLQKKIRFSPLFAIFSGVSCLLMLSILWKPVFPDCFVAGSGLTPFKKISEYVICIIFLTALWLLYKKRKVFYPEVFCFLCWAIALIIASELLLTYYHDPFDLPNSVGHILEILAFAATYKAIIEKGLVHPYDLVFRELKLKEAGLRASEAKFRDLFEFSGVGLAQINPETKLFERINRKFCKITGYTEEELKKTVCGSLAIENRNPDGSCKCHPDRVSREKYCHKNGIVIWVEQTCTTIHDGNGSPQYTLLAIQDITDRMKVEIALQESEARYRTLFDSMTEGFALHEIICDNHGIPCDYRFLDVNPAFERITGLKRAEVLLKTHNEILPDDDPRWVAEYGKVALTGKSVRFENYSPVLDRHYDIFAYCPAPRKFAVIFVDNTELKQMRDEISYLASFPMLNRHPITEADMNGHIHFANPAAKHLFPEIEAQNDKHPWMVDWKTVVQACKEPNAVLPDREVVINDRWFHQSLSFMPESGRIRIYGVEITGRVKARLREKEAIAAVSAARSAIEMVNALNEGIVLMKLDGTILNANPAALSMTGFNLKDVAGKNASEFLTGLLNGSDLNLARQALSDIRKKQNPYLRTIRFHPSGTRTLYISPSVSFIESPHGLQETVVITLKDITELHENTEILERVFDNRHISIVYLDRQFNFVRVNKTYADVCGKPIDFFPGKNHFALYPHKENNRIFRHVIETGESYTVYDKPFEFPNHPEQGTTYWNWSLQPIKDEKGEVEALVFCLQDTTRRKMAQLALEESERRYRELIENANSIIMRITPDHRITFFNEYAQKFFGYSIEEVLDKSVLETIVPPIDSAGNDLRQMTESITAHPEFYATNENENVCKNGRRVWVSWTNKVIRDENGTVSEILCIGTDATARKRIQDENQLYQQRLRRLAEQLAVNEEQERWQISRYIHDTIVQNLSLSSIKLGSVQNSAAENDLNHTVSVLKATRELINEAINECRTAMSELTPPLLYELGLIPALIELSTHLERHHDVKITVKQNEALGHLDRALRGLLFQSVRELVMNALKHASCSQICISVSQSENEIQACVQDDGRGFELSQLNSHQTDHSGGFGLFSVRERVENLGGRLKIKSQPDNGTEIRISIPLTRSET